jgi:uncharacterized protein (DUF1697 family)
MIVTPNKGFETRSDKPNENWYSSNDCYAIDETTKEGKTLAKKIQANYPYYDLVVENGVLTDVTPYNPIDVQLQTNPNLGENQIYADGTDTATLTATVDDTTSTETIELYNGDLLVDSKPAVNGAAAFEITMTETGELTLTVKSTTKYGQADVTIEGV